MRQGVFFPKRIYLVNKCLIINILNEMAAFNMRKLKQVGQRDQVLRFLK